MRFLRLSFFVLAVVGMCFGSINNAYAKETNLPDIPKSISKRVNPIFVEFEGNDSIGSMLSTRLKEQFNTSNLFSLVGKDIPKFRILISSVSEFDTRPSVGSAYSVVWLFSLSDGTLRHFLAMDVGVLSSDGVNDLAARLVEKTDSLVNRYAYLFPDKE